MLIKCNIEFLKNLPSDIWDCSDLSNQILISSPEYRVHVLAQNFGTNELSCRVTGNAALFTAEQSGGYTDISEIPIDHDQKCLPSVYGNKLTITEIDSDRWIEIRKKRDDFLMKSDYTQAGDFISGLTADEVADYIVYREILRDLPQDYSNPDEVIWPDV